MKVRLGHVVHTFGARPLPAVLDEIAGIGYRGVEMFANQASAYYRRPGDLADLLRGRGLVLSSLYFPADLVHPDQAEASVAAAAQAARLLASLGARHLIVGEGTGPAGDNVDYEAASRTLERIGDACLARGVLACFHPHMGSIVESPAQIERIFALTDPQRVFFCLDTGHVAKGGSDPVALTRAYLDRLRFVHLKDMLPGGRFVELGRGSLDNHGVLEMLAGCGYEGWILPEVPVSDASERSAAASAAVSFDYLRAYLAGSISAQVEESR